MRRALLLVPADSEDFLVEELRALARVASYEIVGEVRLRRRGKSYALTEHKLAEISSKIEASGAEVVLCGAALPPSSILKIARRVKREVVDRTLLLLEVFERNAGSREAKLQIETARLKHMLPLLRESINLLKRGELPGFLSGGTYAADKYYLHVRKKVSENYKKLREIAERRWMLRARRRELGLPLVAITGFANAGKTSIFNALTGSTKEVGPVPFTTLTPKTARGPRLGGERDLSVLFIDTVGFIINVPPEVVEAFYSTLEEVVYSDVLLFVVDSSESLEALSFKIGEARRILANIGALHKPVLVVVNKIDLLNGEDLNVRLQVVREAASRAFPTLIGVVATSATKSVGLDFLVRSLWDYLSRSSTC
ncbi:MAG: GTPase [Fervidicoccaceae archaeon]